MTRERSIFGPKIAIWIAALLAIIAAGTRCYLRQLDEGLVVTGMSRDVTWGLYIAKFTFAVGIAASAVMLVLPYYLHDQKTFAPLVIFGEVVAIAAVIACMLFIFADMGRPDRVLNVLLHPSPRSMMFWDMVSLVGYLLLNAIIVAVTLDSQRNEAPPPAWLRPVILLSIPWAISIHTVTAFLYCGLPGRSFWLTAILAPRFLASAFASGPALLILLAMVLRRYAAIAVDDEAIRKLRLILTYALLMNVFFLLLEVFTAGYSQIPQYTEHLRYLFLGIDGRHALVPWMWTSATLAIAAAVILLTRAGDRRLLIVACACVIVSVWIEKGMGTVIAGFVPSPSGAVTEYSPTGPEIAITAGIWAMGALIATVLIAVVLRVRADSTSFGLEMSHEH